MQDTGRDSVQGRTQDVRVTEVGGRRRRIETGIAAAVLVVAFALSWLRLPSDARRVVWAEDGRDFVMDTLQHGVLGSVTLPYAAYLHQWPRIVTAVVERTLPPDRWATGLAVGAFLGTAVVATVVFVCARSVTDSLRWCTAVVVRVALAFVVVLVPLAPHEVLGNVANVHAYFLWMMPWALLYRPRSWWGGGVLAVVVLLGALTETQALVFAPLLVLLLRVRNRHAWPVGIAFVVGAVCQVTTWLTFDQAREQAGRAHIDVASIVQGFAINGSMTTFLPRTAIGAVLADGGVWVSLLFVVPFAAALVRVVFLGDRQQRTLAVTLTTAAVVLWCADVVLNPKPAYAYDGMSTTFLRYAWVSRYGMFPACAGLVLVVLALLVRRRSARQTGEARQTGKAQQTGEARHRPAAQRLPVVRSAFGVLAVVVVLVQFRPLGPTLRSDGPDWPTAVEAARSACVDLPPDQLVRIRTSPTTQQDVPGPPDRQGPAAIWNVTMSCAVVDGTSRNDGRLGAPDHSVSLPTFG